MIDPLDAKTSAALDRYTVPSISADFADRVMARALSASPAQPITAAPRDRRGAWKRARTIFMGVGALSVMSAAAAATGIFGDVAKDVPLIGPLIASIAPATAPPTTRTAPKPLAAKRVKPPEPAESEAPIVTMPSAPDPVPDADSRDPLGREVRLLARIEALQARRAEKGLPPLAPAQARIRAQIAMLSPEMRQDIETRVNARLNHEQASGAVAPGVRRKIVAEELRAMKLETRIERIQARRQEKGLAALSPDEARLRATIASRPPEERAAIKQRLKSRIEAEKKNGTLSPTERRSVIAQEMRLIREERAQQQSQTPPVIDIPATP
jgi:hypothetical protein